MRRVVLFLATIGAVVYFLVFPQDFDPAMTAFVATTQLQAAAIGPAMPTETVS